MAIVEIVPGFHFRNQWWSTVALRLSPYRYQLTIYYSSQLQAKSETAIDIFLREVSGVRIEEISEDILGLLMVHAHFS